MESAGFDEWFSGDGALLEDALAEFDLIPADALFQEMPDPMLTPGQVLAQVASLAPGPDAVALLVGLDGQSLTSREALDVAAEWERVSRWVTARQQLAMVAFVGPVKALFTAQDAHRAESSNLLELAATLDRGPDLTRIQVAQARRLHGTLASTGRALAAGVISEYRARKIGEALARLDPQVARDIEATVLPGAGQVTLSSLCRRLRKAVLKAQGSQAVEEHQAGAADRKVIVDRGPDQPGLLGLHAYLPPEQTLAIRDTLEAKAAEFKKADRAARVAGELAVRRTKDQRIADALAWFILGPHPEDNSRPARPKILVQVTLDLPTLLHLQQHPGQLGEYGPIPPEIARELAGDAAWQRFVHEPVTGYLIDQGNQIYPPRPWLRSFAQARDVHCRFPGTGRTAKNADFDHTQPFDPGVGGHTSATNGAMLSKIGHTAKTHNNWQVTGNANGPLTWTSPHGHTYTTTPHDYRADDGPPPF